MRSFVVGGAGFIGSHLVERLVRRGPVTVFDDLSVGKRAFLEPHLSEGRVTLVEGDARLLPELEAVMGGHDIVFHLAANPEARRGLVDTRLDLEVGTIATYNVLETARRRRVPRLVLASSGTVYGETEKTCSEDDLGKLPISLYGASKLACEGLVSAFAECFDVMGLVFRFGNVVGPRGTHGAVLDFFHKLRATPDELVVLGDGSQSKPYLYVEDCVDAMLHALDHVMTTGAKLDVFNIAPPDATTVRFLAEACVAASPSPAARIRYTGGDRGWPGDVPRSRMSSEKLAKTGFALRHTSDEAARRSILALAREVFG